MDEYPHNPPRADGPMPHLSAGRYLVPQRYVIGWPDGVIKIGKTMHGRRRWGRFLSSGGTMLDLAYYEDIRDALRGEQWLDRQVHRKYRRAFRNRESAASHIGPSGGHSECYLVPPEDWPSIVELARSV